MRNMVLVMVLAVVLGCEQRKSRDEAANEVVADFVTRYEMAKQSGGPIDRCAAAGMVMAAMQQAHDDAGYAKWAAIKSADCRAAGAE